MLAFLLSVSATPTAVPDTASSGIPEFWSGAGVALLTMLFGSLIGPLVTDGVKRRNDRRDEARKTRAASIERIHAAVRSVVRYQRKRRDPEYALAVEDLEAAIYSLDLAVVGAAGTLELQDALLRAVYIARNSPADSDLWLTFSACMSRLRQLDHRPMMARGLAALVRKRMEEQWSLFLAAETARKQELRP